MRIKTLLLYVALAALVAGSALSDTTVSAGIGGYNHKIENGVYKACFYSGAWASSDNPYYVKAMTYTRMQVYRNGYGQIDPSDPRFKRGPLYDNTCPFYINGGLNSGLYSSDVPGTYTVTFWAEAHIFRAYPQTPISDTAQETPPALVLE